MGFVLPLSKVGEQKIHMILSNSQALNLFFFFQMLLITHEQVMALSRSVVNWGQTYKDLAWVFTYKARYHLFGGWDL